MQTRSPKVPDATAVPTAHGALPPVDNSVEVDVDNDPGNEDPGSQFGRDATVPLINPDDLKH